MHSAKLSILILLLGCVSCWAGVTAERLQCEYLTNPLGIDASEPRLSWIVQSEVRGQRQTAYQILVSATPQALAEDRGDLWDSGRVVSDQTAHVKYAGKPLQRRMQCYWKVRIWDVDGLPSPWSKAAQWSMGLLSPDDWQAAWIANANAAPPSSIEQHNGYHSQRSDSADAVKWVTVDLGKDCVIDALRLFPLKPNSWVGCTFYFPLRFRVECAKKADFSDAKTIVDRMDADVQNPSGDPMLFPFEPCDARYVRITMTRLAPHQDGGYAAALVELQVLAGEKNVAEHAKVTASDSLESGGWSASDLTDGRLLAEYVDEPVQPATMLRKEFKIPSKVRRATVSVTGLGLYELRLNGNRVGDELLTPEWTRYTKRIQYQTYDVTDLLHDGVNAIGAQLNSGWWASPLMMKPPADKWPQFCLLMRLDIELSDGTVQTIVSDSSWHATTDGPIRRAGIYFGETYDATREMPGWDQPGFEETGWQPACTLSHPEGCQQAVLTARCGEPIRVVEQLKPVKMTEPTPGVYVYDMGQNMVGWCRLKADAPAGTKITVRYAEAINEDGNIYTANLRGAAQVNEYIWRGGPAELEPHFTYHGFRYVELTGLPTKPAEDAVVGQVFHSASPAVGRFECSNELINKIMHCVDWVQRGNMMSAPTDCPQRTEREGWMGDIQAFAQTAIFDRNMAGFLTKWVRDIRDSQADDGRYPDVAPHIADPNWFLSGVPAWGDAGVVVPWRMYENYADLQMLQEHFQSVQRWIEFIRNRNPDAIWRNNRGNDYGDWLNGDTLVLQGYPRGISEVSKELFATAFYAHSVDLASRMAERLGLKAEADDYRKLYERIKAAFQREYVASDGRIRGDTQAGYALALHFNLLDESQRRPATEYLMAAIQKYGNHASTGIQTTHRMLLELSRNGQHEEAYRLANLRTAPSWGYMVDMGATTIWERWDGYVKGRGFQDPVMNSLNHWAFGSVGEWIWRELVGLNPDLTQPGYKSFFIRPRPCADLTWVKASYDSMRGPIAVEWRIDGNRFNLYVEVPANTSARIYLPTDDAALATESGLPAQTAKGVTFVAQDADTAVFTVTSGKYAFQCPWKPSKTTVSK